MKKVIQVISYPHIVLPIIGINLSAVILFIFLNNFLPPEVPLLYGLPYGEDQLVSKNLLLMPLGISTLVLVINSVLIKLTKDSFSRLALLYLIVGVNLLAIITVVKIALLVGSIKPFY